MSTTPAPNPDNAGAAAARKPFLFDISGVDLKAVVPGLARERDLPALTERMVERGWSEENLRKVLGANWLRVFRDCL